MKQTIKQWCCEHGVNWLGQGSIGDIRYDWKIVLGKGRTAIFTTTVKGDLPETRNIGKRDVLLFPNVNRPKDGGKISKTAFLSIINWVEDCLDGNVRKLKAPNNRLQPYQEKLNATSPSGLGTRSPKNDN
jgi:hypothetical protein